MARVTGLTQHLARLKKLSGPHMERRVGRALFVAADMIAKEAQNSITEGSVSGKNHVPSAPGTPPHNDTGMLRDSIETVQTGPLTLEISVDAPYAAVHEFGSSKHPARPFLRPAVARKRREAIDIVEAAVSQAVRL